jgi:hypothetical protein
VSTVFGSVFCHTRLKILTLPKRFVPGPLYVDYINLLLGTDTIFSSQVFHSQDAPLTERQSSSTEGDGSCRGDGDVSNEGGRERRQR